jgi:hypothetical protein
MTYKETLFFIGQSLTINHSTENKIAIEKQLKENSVDWDAVVKVSTGHFVFPALYCNLKRTNFLHYLPEELFNYMVHITDLNRERNQKIIAEAKEINELLLANNITPIFLKGTGNLLEGLYEDIGERMVGDIDFIVSRDEYLKTISILDKNNYKILKESDNYRTFHWHYPALVNPEKIGAVEVHNKILKKPYEYLLNNNILYKDLIKKQETHFLSTKNKLLNAILPKIINDHLYYSQNISLRTMYDVFLISKIEEFQIDIESKAIFKKFNNVLGCIQMVLNCSETIRMEETKSTKEYKRRYLLRLDNSKKEKIKSDIIDYLIKYREKLFILKMAFYDKEYKNFVLKEFAKINFYKKLLGIKSTI